MAPSIACIAPNRGGVWMEPSSANAAVKFFGARVGLDARTGQEDTEQPCS